MDEQGLGLTDTDRFLIERSTDLDISRRRVRLVVLSAVLLIAALVIAAPLTSSWQFLLFFAVAYIAITAWERVGYARTIIAYKQLIQKLARRIDELEEPASPPAGP
jgi:hypothetical protein